MAHRPSPARVGILRAMSSRSAPLIRCERRWFVRGWAATVRTEDVEALIVAGMIGSTTTRGRPRLLVLTDAGRALAAREAALAEGIARTTRPNDIRGVSA